MFSLYITVSNILEKAVSSEEACSEKYSIYHMLM